LIRNRVYDKGTVVYALISPKGKYDTLFPVKGIIYDVKHSDSIVEYQIRISHFYDDINFIKRHFISAQFERDFDGKMIHLRTKYSRFKSIKEFNEHILSTNFIVVVDGPMVHKRRHEMQTLFNNIHDFFIEKKIASVYDTCSRSYYNDGTYYYKSKGVFKAHLKKFLGDRGYGTDSFLDDILYRPSADRLDKTS